MCVIAINPTGTGKTYVAGEDVMANEGKHQALAKERVARLELELGSSSLDEPIPPTGNAGLATGKSYLYGIRTFRKMFTPRQQCVLLTFAQQIRKAHAAMCAEGVDQTRAEAIATYLAMWLSRLVDRCNSLCRWNNAREVIQGLTDMKRFAMMWDFPEVNVFGNGSGSAKTCLDYIAAVIRKEGQYGNAVHVSRASATELPFDDAYFDAVVTDPPYYDNESYSELSDACYVWLRPAIGFLYPEHFAGQLTPKKKECVAAAYRQGGTKEAAYRCYDDCILRSLREANRVLSPHGILVTVYAHKTTLGWATLVDALRRSNFEVIEAWPVDTETKARVAHQGDAALRSSIFLVARKRDAETAVGQFETDVVEELRQTVRERVETLWAMGIAGADLVIACVGAGLRAFTKYERVEYANGEEVPAERFLGEVEGVVLDAILHRLSKEASKNGKTVTLAGVDEATRFYILWRYAYRNAPLDAGEAIIFANGTHVELDGQNGLSSGAYAIVEKKKSDYRLLDFTERGSEEKLGLSDGDGRPASLIDVLHRVLWLMENSPRKLTEFLGLAQPHHERLRLVAQALAGAALSGKSKEEAERLVATTTSEQAALGKLLANWKSLLPDSLFDAAKR